LAQWDPERAHPLLSVLGTLYFEIEEAERIVISNLTNDKAPIMKNSPQPIRSKKKKNMIS